MNGKLTSPATDLDPGPKRSAPQPQPLPQEVKLPPFMVGMEHTYNRWSRMQWALFGSTGYGTMVGGLISIPRVNDYFVFFFLYPVMCLFFLPVYLIILYYSRVSHHMPSKPVGRYAKHGFELLAVTYVVIVIWLDRVRRFPALCLITGINMEFHTAYQLLRNSANLGWSDFFLVEVMQVAVFAISDYEYAVVVTFIACLMVIGYRFYSYSCIETSDAPVSVVQKFGSEKAC